MRDPAAFESTISAGQRSRQVVQQQRARVALGMSTAILVVWAVYVTLAGHWGRVGDNWAAAVTMVFGSFVAGSTPQGGGAVAFPVFTKVLEVDAQVARSFSLCIQAVGMGSAATAIVLTRRVVEWRAVATTLPAAIAGFLAGAFLLGRSDEPFWPSRLPGAYVKVTFTLIVAAMAVVVYLGFRAHLLERLVAMPIAGPRVLSALVVTGLVGGLASSLVGSGADVFLYLTVVVLIGVSPRVGVPTSVVVMAGVSVVGFLVMGVLDGQLAVGLDGAGRVTELGGDAVGATAGGAVVFGGATPLDPDRYDLFGFWLAAAPVVAFGAPLGSWAVARVTDRQLVRFVVLLASAETLSTVIFLDGLLNEPDAALIAYAVVGAAVVIGGLWMLERFRRQVLGLPLVDLDKSFTRTRLDTGPRFREQLADTTTDRTRDDGEGAPAPEAEPEGGNETS